MNAELLAVFGDDLMVVNTARVSFAKWHQQLDASDNHLIEYLAKHNHWSPFAHPKLQFRIKLPIFVARQWEKHRIGCVRGYDIYDHNEMSRRYVTDTVTCYQPVTWRSTPYDKKQGSGADLPNDLQHEAMQLYANAISVATDTYQQLLALGVAPEQARICLPVSHYTSWIETGSLIYWFRLCQLRLDHHAQLEIAQLAQQIAALIMPAFPMSWNALLSANEIKQC